MTRRNYKKIIIFIFIIIAIIAGVVVIISLNNNTLKLEEISKEDIQYYVLKKEDKYGVINKDGNVLIEPQYAAVKIPNPTKEVFICTDSLKQNEKLWKAVNSKNDPILTEYSEVEAIEINQSTSTIPYEKTVLKYKEGNLYGLIDFEGKKVLDAKYEEIVNLDYKEGYLKVKKDGLYGITNIKGREIIKNEYENINSDGYYNKESKYQNAGFVLRSKTDDGYRFGYANKDGKIELDTIYNEINRITEIENEKDVYLISSTNGRYGLIKNGKNVIENEYLNMLYDKNSNLLVVDKGQAQGVLNLEGKEIIPIDYNEITIGGDYIKADKGNSTIIFDSQGNQINTDVVNHMKANDNYSITIDKQGVYNIVDNSNKKMLNSTYMYIEYYDNDLFIATKNGKAGIITPNENIKVPFQYGTIQKIKDLNLLKATITENGEIDLINSNGEIIKGLEQAQMEKTDKYIKIYSKNGLKYYDLEGKETSYQALYPNNSIYASCKNGKWGFVNASGQTVVSFVYDMVTEENNGVAGILSNNLWGVIDNTGKVILEPVYKIGIDNGMPTFISTYYEINDNMGNTIYTSDVPKNKEMNNQNNRDNEDN